MFKDASFEDFLATGLARLVGSKVGPSEVIYQGIEVREGHVVIDGQLQLPVLAGVTSTSAFGRLRADKYQHLVESGLGPVRGTITDALFVGGDTNYYHFLAFELPVFLLMRALPSQSISIVMRFPLLPSMADLLKDAIAYLAGGRQVSLTMVEDGTYAVNNVLFGRPGSAALNVLLCRELLYPIALARTGVKDPMKDLGPLKLFVRRSAGTRNLRNQDEVEAWCRAQGYIAVNPGAMKFEEQILLFSRATHIVGVEGAAMSNLLFALNARHVVMIASPLVRGEKFFTLLAKYCAYTFQVVDGTLVNEGSLDRANDYTVSLDMLKATITL